ncbi:MAG: hypothetical protein HY423_06665 [Candidatus Lambdaproteobacteria bacterium]|nr:hypothetical protein [Candidatus Lambdaproteobacteria bacterium]
MGNFLRWAALAVIAVVSIATPLSFAQTPSVVSVFSLWVQFSLRGHSQEEIESLLRNMDPKTIDDVKARLRRNVLVNLDLKHVGRRYLAARDRDDLLVLQETIHTEIRFAGLTSDQELLVQIRERFGIPADQL